MKTQVFNQINSNGQTIDSTSRFKNGASGGIGLFFLFLCFDFPRFKAKFASEIDSIAFIFPFFQEIFSIFLVIFFGFEIVVSIKG
jgi:hypothetical protein